MAILVNEPMTSAPTTGTLKNSAAHVTVPFNALRLNAAVAGQQGQIEYSGITLDDPFTIEFDFWTGGGTGGDAVWFYFGNSSTPAQEDSAAGGYHVMYGEFAGAVRIYWNGSQIKTQAVANIGNSTWHTAKITYDAQIFEVFMDGVSIYSHTDATPRTWGGNLFGWGARSGFGNNNNHYVRNLLVTDNSGGGGGFVSAPKMLPFFMP